MPFTNGDGPLAVSPITVAVVAADERWAVTAGPGVARGDLVGDERPPAGSLAR